MNQIELPELMRERAADSPTPILVDNRIDGIRRKVTTVRRRQWSAGLVALALIGTGLASMHGAARSNTTTASRPSSSPSSISIEFPLRSHGAKRIAVEEGSLQETLTVTVLVPTTRLLFTVACPRADESAAVWLVFTAGGEDQGTGTCNATAGNAYTILDNPGVPPGSPIAITFTPVHTNHEDRTTGADPDMPAGQIVVGIYESLSNN
jgi:hypothetical protein